MPDRVIEVATDVFLGRGTDVNWVLLRDGTDLTLIDAGYPRDVSAVEESLRAIGRRPQDVRAVLVTHAHVDHVGGVAALHERYGTPIYTDPVEVAHARREYLEQAGRLDVVRNLWRPGAAAWVRRVMRAGATEPVRLLAAEPFPVAGPLDLPGAPVPVPTHGHTSGHTAYHLPAAGAVVTGDALVTGHAVLRRPGPQVLPAMFNHGDPLAGLTGLVGLDADLVLPGHGEPLRQPISDAVAAARRAAA